MMKQAHRRRGLDRVLHAAAALALATLIPLGAASAAPGGVPGAPAWAGGPGGGSGGPGGPGGQPPGQNDPPGNIPRQLTLIQMGDIHGHLIPRPNLRSDGNGQLEGGLAHMYTLIQEIEADNPRRTLLFNTGDTIQGGAEALYTEGQAVVDILDLFGIDGFAPGNWDYVYGTERFVELFGSGRWGAVAMNVYYSDELYPERAGELVLPPYIMKNVNGIRVAILGISSERAINALGAWRTEGLIFTGEGDELPGWIDVVRNQERADVVVLLSEYGLAKNIDLANRYPGIDVLLSSDMHEETPEPIYSTNGTLISEAGQDGTQVAEVTLNMRGKQIVSKEYEWHTVTSESIPAHPLIAAQVEEERFPFVSDGGFQLHENPINQTFLERPIDTVEGYTATGLYRGNFSQEALPGVIEGTSHDFLADAFRDQAEADIGSIRGFRYGTHVEPGEILLEDLFHYMPVGPQIAKITILGQQLKNQMENSADGAFNDDVFLWTGGWFFGYSGVRADLDPYAPKGSRFTNIEVMRWGTDTWEPLDLTAEYTYAGYWFEQNPQFVNGIMTTGEVDVVTDPMGMTTDATDVVSRYLVEQGIVEPVTGRINLLEPLPPYLYGNPEIQPLQGVPVGNL